MKSRKILYLIAGIFNCIVGGIGILFGLLVLLLSSFVRKMFESSTDLVSEFVTELASADSNYAYLQDLSNAEVVSFIMKIVYVTCAILLVICAIWITLGVFNILLKNRHDKVFESKRYLRHIFIVGSWLLMGLNPANILTTIAVYKKNKTPQPALYSAN